MLLNSFFCAICEPSVSTCFAKKINPTFPILRYNSRLDDWTVVNLISDKFKSLIFSIPSKCTTNMLILKTLYDFSLSPEQFSYDRIKRKGWKSCANIGPVGELENFERRREICFVGATTSGVGCLPLIRKVGKHDTLMIWSVLMEGKFNFGA
jgi:hypothetical protein